jgi:hypothetical protein
MSMARLEVYKQSHSRHEAVGMTVAREIELAAPFLEHGSTDGERSRHQDQQSGRRWNDNRNQALSVVSSAITKMVRRHSARRGSASHLKFSSPTANGQNQGADNAGGVLPKPTE